MPADNKNQMIRFKHNYFISNNNILFGLGVKNSGKKTG
jgi:hypothetical protein